jgi:tRNA U34 2-thiouridine synthase MnmA/TrmU
VTPTGERVGKNEGMWYYTIGQGAKLSGMREKWFVAKKGVGEGGRDVLVVPGSYV